MALKQKLNSILIVFVSFWIFPILTIILNIIVNSKSEKYTNTYLYVSFKQILLSNLFLFIVIIITGYLTKLIPYILYYSNAIRFSIIFSISLTDKGVLKTLLLTIPHGLLEILAFSIATFIGVNFKDISKNKRLLIIGLIFILLAAIIEYRVTITFR